MLISCTTVPPGKPYTPYPYLKFSHLWIHSQRSSACSQHSQAGMPVSSSNAALRLIERRVDSISVTLTSRLMLNLHRNAANEPGLSTTEGDNIARSTKMVFRIHRAISGHRSGEVENNGTTGSSSSGATTYEFSTVTEQQDLSRMSGTSV